MFRTVLSVVLTGALTLAACAPAATPAPVATPQPPQPRSGPLNVVATFSIIGDWVRAVAGDKVNLTVLVGADSDAHTFAPSPADGVAVQNAHIIFENGLEFETWLDGLYVSSNAMAQRVVLSDGLERLAMEEHGAEHADDHDHADHAHGDYNPHVWQSVPNAMHMVKAIRDTLSSADPANASVYAQNAQTYLAELQALDDFIRAEVGKIPPAKRKLVTSHDTLAYFAAAYGFEVVGTALGSISTEAADPSAGALADLVKDIRAAGVPAIFAENIANTRLMSTLAAEAGVTLAPPLYTDALGAPGSAGATYLAMMRYNAQTIVTALAAP